MPTDPPPFHAQVAAAIASHRDLDVALYGPMGSGRPELEMSPEAAQELVAGPNWKPTDPKVNLTSFCLCRVSVNPRLTGQHVKIVTRRWPRPAAGDPTTMEDSNGGAA